MCGRKLSVDIMAVVGEVFKFMY